MRADHRRGRSPLLRGALELLRIESMTMSISFSHTHKHHGHTGRGALLRVQVGL